MEEQKKTIAEIQKAKTDLIMETVRKRAAYYRANPSRFVEEYLGIKGLKWFQKILLWCMMHYVNVMYLAARGQQNKYLYLLKRI